MDTQIFQIRFGNHSAYTVRQPANAQLQCCPIGNGFDDIRSYFLIDIVSKDERNSRHWHIRRFDDGIDVRNMDGFPTAAKTARHMRIDFDDDFFSLFRNSLGHGRTKAKVKISVFIHRRYSNHRHIDINDIAVNRRFITETHRIKKHA